MKGRIAMVASVIMNMYKSTDDNGTLFINGWGIKPEETSSFPRFYKCTMSWDLSKALDIAGQASELCSGLFALGEYCERTEQGDFIMPDPYCIDDDEISEAVISAWEMFFDGFDYESISSDELEMIAQQRLGGNKNAYNTFIFARRLFTAVKLGAPRMVIDCLVYDLARCFALTKACEDIVCLDLINDTFDSKTQSMGEFSPDDIKSVLKLICDDCTIMPDAEMGRTLLINMIYSTRRLDLYRQSKILGRVVDILLGTLEKHERKIIEELYGLNDGVRKSAERVAAEMCLPTDAVKYYKAAAICKLRHPSRTRMLEKQLTCELHG